MEDDDDDALDQEPSSPISKRLLVPSSSGTTPPTKHHPRQSDLTLEQHALEGTFGNRSGNEEMILMESDDCDEATELLPKCSSDPDALCINFISKTDRWFNVKRQDEAQTLEGDFGGRTLDIGFSSTIKMAEDVVAFSPNEGPLENPTILSHFGVGHSVNTSKTADTVEPLGNSGIVSHRGVNDERNTFNTDDTGRFPSTEKELPNSENVNRRVCGSSMDAHFRQERYSCGDLEEDGDSMHVHSVSGSRKRHSSPFACCPNPLATGNSCLSDLVHILPQRDEPSRRRPPLVNRIEKCNSIADLLPDYSTAVHQLEGSEQTKEKTKEKTKANDRPMDLCRLNKELDEEIIGAPIRESRAERKSRERTSFIDMDKIKEEKDTIRSDLDEIEDYDVDDVKSGLELFLPSRRKASRVNRIRFVAFLLKYILFLLNFLFWVTSVVAIVIGGWVLSERGQLVRDPGSFFLDPSAMLCLLGALSFLVAFCGCLGALRENICLLRVYQISMMAVLALEFLVALMVFAFYHMPKFRKTLRAGPEEVLTSAIRRYHDDDELRRWIDFIQTEFKCCGARHSESGYQDWQQNPYFNCTPENPSAKRCGVPRSCCIIDPGEYINYMCGYDTTNKQQSEVYDRIRTQGCMKGLGQWLSAHDVAIGAVVLAIIIPQIVCVVFARLFVQHIQRQRIRWRVLHTNK
ncbi:uncharacterized protein [Littorina saxatilis]